MNIRSAETGYLKNSGYFARMARRVVLSSALLASSSSGCAPLQLRPGIQMQINNHGQELVIGEGNNAIQFRSTMDLNSHLDKLGKMYALITELNTLIPSWPVRKVVISEDNAGEYKIENNDHLLIVELTDDYFETTAHEWGHAFFEVNLAGQRSARLVAMRDPLWQKIYYFSLANENFTLLRDSNYGQRKSVNVCRESEDGRREEHFENVGHPWHNASELFASAVTAYRLHSDELLKAILDPGTSAEKKRLAIAIWVYLRDKIFSGRYFSVSDPFKGISIKDIDVADKELDSVLRLLLKSERSCANAFYYPKIIFYGPEIYFIRPALEENRNEIIVKLLNDEDPKVREKIISAISFPLEDPPEFSDHIFEPLLNKMAIDDPDEKARDSAKRCLRTNKKWRAKYIIMDLNDPNPEVRQQAAERIYMGEDDADAAAKYMPHLIKLKDKDPNVMVRYKAANALNKTLDRIVRMQRAKAKP